MRLGSVGIGWDGDHTLWFTLNLTLSIYLDNSLLSNPNIIFICYTEKESRRRRRRRRRKSMEACFLTSNSFTKTLELIPSFKTRVFSYPRRSSNAFQSKRVGLSTSITCCHMPSPSADDCQPLLEADWRSFRARMVAKELGPTEPSSTAEPGIGVDQQQPPQITIGDKWAHTIHEPEKGCLLIATEKLDGVHIFERTVILLLSTGPLGPFGIILNRPSLMSIKETRSAVLDVAGTFSDRPLFFGGPLEEGLFLVSPQRGYDNDTVAKSGVFEEVMRGVYYGTRESAGCAAEMARRNVVGLGDFRFFDGYCGWEKEQLKDEIQAGYWTLAACSPSVIGLNKEGTLGLWEEVLWLMGPKKVW